LSLSLLVAVFFRSKRERGKEERQTVSFYVHFSPGWAAGFVDRRGFEPGPLDAQARIESSSEELNARPCAGNLIIPRLQRAFVGPLNTTIAECMTLDPLK
jgi:hypothetical protein